MSGGAGSSAFAWGNLPGGCQAGPTASISCIPSGTGTTNITVEVTDRNGFIVNASGVIVVVPAASLLAGPWPYVALAGLAAVVVAVGAVVWARRRRAPPPEE